MGANVSIGTGDIWRKLRANLNIPAAAKMMHKILRNAKTTTNVYGELKEKSEGGMFNIYSTHL